MTHTTPSLNRRQVLAAAAGGAAVVGAPALFSGSAFAQDKFPSRAITLIAPWPAGGSSDGVMRAIAESGSRALGVPVVVENKPGVGGTLGASAMVGAATAVTTGLANTNASARTFSGRVTAGLTARLAAG